MPQPLLQLCNLAMLPTISTMTMRHPSVPLMHDTAL